MNMRELIKICECACVDTTLRCAHNKFWPVYCEVDSREIIPLGYQLDAQFLLYYVYLNPLHVSSNYVSILRRTIVLTQLLV